MTEPRLDYVMCASPSGLHRMAYWEWGRADNPNVLLCVHGLTRTGRDFDDLARQLVREYRVVCPDVVGRGMSDWLVDPSSYVVPQYVSDMLTLIARLKPDQLDWVGTSMGGLIGLGLAGALALSESQRAQRGTAGLPPGQSLRINKLVLNDIGPGLNFSGLVRIADYVGQPVQLGSFDEAVEYVKSVSPGFGSHTYEQWADLTRHTFRQQDGVWVKHYDLRLAEPMQKQNALTISASEKLLWSAYESLREPVMVIRGERSDLLTAQTVTEMEARNPRTYVVEVPGVGHAPTLRTHEQIDPIEQFLLHDGPEVDP